MNIEIRDWIAAIEAEEDWRPAAGVFADWLESRGDERSIRVRDYIQRGGKEWIAGLFHEAYAEGLGDYDWKEVFAYAGKEKGSESGVPERALPNDTDLSVEPFGRLDIARVIAKSDGENDERDWLVVGELRDGRFFALVAGCDYTGWG